jgi:phosphoglycerate dehydrogenase-like enzyme
MVVAIAGPQRASRLINDLSSAFAREGQEARTLICSDLASVPSLAETILVCMAVPCGAREMDSMPQLRGLVSPVAGYDWIDVEEATRRGIPVVNGGVAENRESMAEATIMLLLALLYRLRETEAQMRQSIPGTAPSRRMLKGRTVGIIGSGGIAREIIHRLAAWDVSLQVHTRHPSPELTDVRRVSLNELLSTSDVVIVMTRLDVDSHHLLNGENLRRLKPGALLVNTSRGGLIEEAGLVEALRSGRIAGAALDVFEVEPLAPDHPLRDFSNVILTPHCIGHTVEMAAAIPRVTVENVRLLLRGKLPESCRNPVVQSQWSA